MMGIREKLGLGGAASKSSFTPRANIPRSDVQSAVEYVMDNAENVGTVYAPTDAQYLTSATSAGLSNERVIQDGVGISWDFTGLGQAVANLVHLGLEDLADPGGDRGMFWDDSEGALKWFTPGGGLGFVGDYLSITDADLAAIVGTTFALGDILYHDGSTLVRLPAGTDGQFLRTRGTATAPDWQNISGGGDMLRANNLSDLTNAATARDNLGVEIGADVQAYDATLASLAALGTAADRIAYTTAIDTWAEATLTSYARTLLDDANQAAARVTLGLTPGTDVQAYDAGLASIAGLTTAADKMIYTTALDTYAVADLTAFARSLLDDATQAAMRITLGLVPGTDVQAYDAELAALAGLTSAADKAPYFTGVGTAALFDLTSFARTLLDDADASAMRTTLGVAIGSDVQAYSANLAAWSAVAPSSYATLAALASTANGQGSALVGIEDAGSYFAGATVEAALQYLGSSIAALDQAVVLKGTWDASVGTFPGGGAAQAGWSYIVSTGGTVGGVEFASGDRVVAVADNASTGTYASNWHKLDYTDQVSSVAGRTGAVTLAVADITDMSANGRSLVSAADYAAMRSLLGLVIGTNVQAYSARLAEIAALAVTDGNFIVGNGSAWVAESGDTARTSLGVGTTDSPQFGGVIVGHSAKIATAIGAGNTVTPDTQLHGTGGAGSSEGLFRWTNTATGPFFSFNKSRGTSIGSYTVVQSGDVLGEIAWLGADGTDFEPAAAFRAEVYGTPGAGDMPGRFVWATTADGAEAVTDRLTLDTVLRMIQSANATQATQTTYPFQLPFGSENLTFGFDGTQQVIQSWNSRALYLNPQGNAVYIGSALAVKASGAQTLTGGFDHTSYSLGTMSNFTVTPANNNLQYGTNNGAFTLTAPASDCEVDILVTNGASAGTITFSGFTAPSGGGGDTYATTNGNKYLLMIRRINGTSTYAWKALQ